MLMKIKLSILLITINLLASAQDLTVEGMDIPNSLLRHEQFNGNITIRNIGILPTEESMVDIVLYSSPIESSIIRSITIPPLDPDESSVLEIPDSTGMNLALGTYTVIAEISQLMGNDVNNSNNSFNYGDFTIEAGSADLTLLPVMLDNDSMLFTGNYLPVYVSVTNEGSGIFRTTVDFYISEDLTISADDYHMNAKTITLDYANTADLEYEIPIPTNIPSGDYYITAIVNESQEIDEIDYSNNQFRFTEIEIIQRDIDISIGNFTLATQHDYGFQLGFNILNDGADPSEFQKLKMYGSNDGLGFDQFLAEIIFDRNINAGDSRAVFDTIPFTEHIHYPFIIMLQDEEEYPQVDATAVFITDERPPKTYDFSIDAVIDGQPETKDPFINLSVSIANLNENQLDGEMTYDVNIISEDGLIEESYSTTGFVDIIDFDTSHFELLLANRSSLIEGRYELSIQATFDAQGTTSTENGIAFTVEESLLNIDADIIGNNGEVITDATIFLYQRIGEGDPVFIESIDLVQNDPSPIRFIRTPGTYLLYVIPDSELFPDYIPTLSGNTFKIEGSSYFNVVDNVVIPINLSYVDPNAAGGLAQVNVSLNEGGVSVPGSQNISSGNPTAWLTNSLAPLNEPNLADLIAKEVYLVND